MAKAPSPNKPVANPDGSITPKPKGRRAKVQEFSDEIMDSDAAHLLQISGMLVFVLAAVLGLFFLFSSPLFLIPDWVRMRTVELFAMLAALGVIVAVVSQTKNGFVIVFGVLLIGALIVPTIDMVSFARLAMGRDAELEQSVGSANDGAEIRGRDTDLANNILAKLEGLEVIRENNAVDVPGTRRQTLIPDVPKGARSNSVREIELALREERMKTNLERLRYRGALNLLLAMAPPDEENGSKDEFQTYVYRFGKEDDFLDDIQTLRQQELVRFSYDDVSGAAVTELGKQVICLHRTNDAVSCAAQGINERDQVARGIFNSRGEQISAAVAQCDESYQSIPAIDFTVDRAAISTPASRRFTLDREQRVSVSLDRRVGSGDPFLYIFEQNDGTCRSVAEDDDGGIDLNARIEEGLSAGNYVVVALSLSGEAIPASLRVVVEAPRSDNANLEGMSDGGELEEEVQEPLAPPVIIETPD